MSREIKSPDKPVTAARSFDDKHTIAFNEGSHRYKWTCECHKKASAVGTTTFLKGGYPVSQQLINWMKGQTASALFTALTVPGDSGYYPREGFWPVTEEMRKDLFKEAVTAHEKVAQTAADIGTITHGYAELDSLGKRDEAEALLAQVKGTTAYSLIEACIVKYKEWALTNRGVLVSAEGLIASPRHQYCGKFDRLDRVAGRLILRDYKTSKGIYVDHMMQMAAYAIAIEEWLGYHVDAYEILRFGKDDGTFETLLIDDVETMTMLKAQVIRCRQTYDFKKLENDKRFS